MSDTAGERQRQAMACLMRAMACRVRARPWRVASGPGHGVSRAGAGGLEVGVRGGDDAVEGLERVGRRQVVAQRRVHPPLHPPPPPRVRFFNLCACARALVELCACGRVADPPRPGYRSGQGAAATPTRAGKRAAGDEQTLRLVGSAC